MFGEVFGASQRFASTGASREVLVVNADDAVPRRDLQTARESTTSTRTAPRSAAEAIERLPGQPVSIAWCCAPALPEMLRRRIF